ncbi:aldehyde dehydrogenase (NADP(+)) [Nocardia sp. NPDC050712]|uniref:aldehyde dehydrogenase (NADP(+)) n=1 Tax=Nocardia sp. NPDC050712 TaxID=3155518 RepID=UPI0033D2B629
MTAVTVWSIDPRTGERRGEIATEAQPSDVDRVVRAAQATSPALEDRGRRALFLRTAARELTADSAALAELADAETALGRIRLVGEIGRTAGQLLAFADVVEAGAFLDIAVDHADPHATPPTPDLRRYKIPLGVVAVYAASNFPFAFSVAGGDTASALAAGCPVVVKAHPGHPATSEATVAIMRRAAQACGLPVEVIGLVHGFDAGLDLIRHPVVAAAGFTGSVRGGRALYNEAAARPTPIPFHGELGSINPVVITEAAAAERAEAIGAGLAASMTLGNGQFCVKPGLVLIPAGLDGDRVVEGLRGALSHSKPGVLLDHRMRDAYLHGVSGRRELSGVRALTETFAPDEHQVVPTALMVAAETVLTDPTHELLLEECFGPTTVVVRYSAPSEISAVLTGVGGSLTATVHLGAQETTDPAGLLKELTRIAGRIVVDDWPTGVAVKPAQHHGGPYPASTSTSTSVGATAIERWLRPIVYQNTPESLLPQELREANPLALPRRVDGQRG